MLVVSDTSPLSNLAIIGRLELLRAQFNEVTMPPAVARELAMLGDPVAQSVLSKARRDGWLVECSLPQGAPFPPELGDLDAGETEALRLALCLSADAVLIDEKEGRICATSLGIRTVGALGVLIAARRTGAIPSLKAEIDKLRHDAGFFLDHKLEARALAAVGE